MRRSNRTPLAALARALAGNPGGGGALGFAWLYHLGGLGRARRSPPHSRPHGCQAARAQPIDEAGHPSCDEEGRNRVAVENAALGFPSALGPRLCCETDGGDGDADEGIIKPATDALPLGEACT